jgi:hypothetical protein
VVTKQKKRFTFSMGVDKCEKKRIGVVIFLAKNHQVVIIIPFLAKEIHIKSLNFTQK